MYGCFEVCSPSIPAPKGLALIWCLCHCHRRVISYSIPWSSSRNGEKKKGKGKRRGAARISETFLVRTWTAVSYLLSGALFSYWSLNSIFPFTNRINDFPTLSVYLRNSLSRFASPQNCPVFSILARVFLSATIVVGTLDTGPLIVTGQWFRDDGLSHLLDNVFFLVALTPALKVDMFSSASLRFWTRLSSDKIDTINICRYSRYVYYARERVWSRSDLSDLEFKFWLTFCENVILLAIWGNKRSWQLFKCVINVNRMKNKPQHYHGLSFCFRHKATCTTLKAWYPQNWQTLTSRCDCVAQHAHVDCIACLVYARKGEDKEADVTKQPRRVSATWKTLIISPWWAHLQMPCLHTKYKVKV